MDIPKKLSRVTNHKKPRHQIYQPGFNPGNGCWLDGGWVTVSAEGFEAKAKEHQKLYVGLWTKLKKQHHRDAGVPIEKMTPAQRQAWEYYSGTGTLEIRYKDGSVGGCRVELAAGLPRADALDWLRRDGMRVIPKVLQPDGSGNPPRVVDQTEGIPADLLTGDTEPVDVWKHVVNQNRDRSAEFSRVMASIALEESSPLAFGVAMQGIIQLEEDMIRLETRKTPDPYDTMDDLRERYRALRAELEAEFGEAFEPIYKQTKANHNEFERLNLDNSDGFLGCYVLPEFHSDGTHEPVGPRDVPWGRDD